MARSTYTEQDRAAVYAALAGNDNNVKRTARETGVPENTVRRWRDEWKKKGPPEGEALTEVVDKILSKIESAREQALDLLKQKMSDATPQQLATIFGILDDKYTRVKGLDKKTVDVHHHLPPAEELRELMGGFVQGAIEAAQTRHSEVIDLDIVEVRELPA